MKVLLFRHGTVQHKKEKIYLGRTDLPLNNEGRRQGEAWKRYFHWRLPDRILSSPLSRALEFARILAGDRAEEVAVCSELAEIDLGDWDGRPMDEVRRKNPAAWVQRGKNLETFRPPGGENFEDVEKRVVPTLKEVMTQNDRELAIVAHAGVNRVILCHLLGIPLAHLFRLGQNYGCLNIIEIKADQTRISCINMPCPEMKTSLRKHRPILDH